MVRPTEVPSAPPPAFWLARLPAGGWLRWRFLDALLARSQEQNRVAQEDGSAVSAVHPVRQYMRVKLCKRWAELARAGGDGERSGMGEQRRLGLDFCEDEVRLC